MTTQPPTPPGAQRVFCGECGTPNEGGAAFCGECGSPLEAPFPAASAPPWEPAAAPAPAAPAPAPATLTAPGGVQPAPFRPARPSYAPAAASGTCPLCLASTKRGQPFCRICGANLATGAPTAWPRPSPNTRPATQTAAVGVAPAATSAAAAPAANTAPGTNVTPGAGKKLSAVVVPVLSLLVTYYLTQRVLGPILGPGLGDVGRRIVPLAVSMAVGTVARILMR